VVDDDRIIGEMLKFMLEHKGYSVMVSQKPGQLIENIINNKIDLLLLDQFLSGTSGIEICKEIRRNETICTMPIVMLSAEQEVRKKCLEAGATDFMHKPFERQVLLNKIKNIFEEHHT